jgi:gliding-associated putative ABC transporter substrate-binding component GldG
MASKRIKLGSNAVLFTLLVIGIVVLANLVTSRLFARVDLTQDQIFTLSDASKRMVAGLPDRLTVKAFISKDLPHQQLQAIGRYLKDLLEEYARNSNGKMVWEALDPGKDEKIEQEARRLKVFPTRLSVREKTKVSVTQGYLGVAFQYGGKVESLPFVADIATLEYQISSTIRRLTGNKKKVGFTSGHGEPSLHQGLTAVQKALKDHDVTTVDLTEGKNPIPDDIDLLVMVGPRKQLAERALYEIDRFLIKGKSVAMFIDGMILETPRGHFQPGQVKPRIARANVVGLRPMLRHYGVELGKDLIMDRQNQRVVLPAGQNQRVVTNYPAFPVVTNLSRQNPITKLLRAYVSVFPSSLKLTKAAKGGGVTATVLASSTAASWRQTGFFLFDPMRQPQPTKELGPFRLALLLQGKFGSYFAGKPVPAPGPATPPKENEPRPSKTGPRSPAGTRLVVFGDADMVQDQFLGLNQANLMLLQNTVDYLIEDVSMITIRSKSQTRRPLKSLDDDKVTLAKWINIVGLPAAFVLLGFVRWRVRRGSRRRVAARLVAEHKKPRTAEKKQKDQAGEA